MFSREDAIYLCVYPGKEKKPVQMGIASASPSA